MTLRRTLLAAAAAVPAFLTLAVYSARLGDLQLDLDAEDLDAQLMGRNDD